MKKEKSLFTYQFNRTALQSNFACTSANGKGQQNALVKTEVQFHLTDFWVYVEYGHFSGFVNRARREGKIKFQRAFQVDEFVTHLRSHRPTPFSSQWKWVCVRLCP